MLIVAPRRSNGVAIKRLGRQRRIAESLFATMVFGGRLSIITQTQAAEVGPGNFLYYYGNDPSEKR